MELLFLPPLTAAVIFYLYRSGRLPRRGCALLLMATIVAGGLLLREVYLGTRTEVTALPADAGGLLHEPVPLIVETSDGQSEQVLIRIPTPTPTQEEIHTMLERAAASLEEQILGENPSFSAIDRDLSLPYSLENGEISVLWTSSRPDVLNTQGQIGAAAEAEGSEVLLRAVLSKGEESLEVQRIVRVFPSQEPDAVANRLQDAADRLNENHEDEYLLPQTLNGTRLTWFRESGSKGRDLCLLVLLVSALGAAADRQKKEKKQKRRAEELQRAYPEILGRLHLLLAAGLSLRKAWERLAADAARQVARTGKATALGEEIRHTWADLENGMTETDALTQFGERCDLAAYRSLALLLIQNQTRGGHHLLDLLENEVQQAFEDRKRQARMAGEKAAVRLAIPMGMMLMVVLIIILVPAVLSF